MSATATIETIADLYATWGPNRYDEELSQLDHALQTAALAAAAGAGDALVAAALLHDIGHLLALARGDDGPAQIDLAHEAVGARYLARLFPPSVTGPIALHVAAKRYRCAVDADYGDGLSAGSRRSLALQGGPMSPEEVGVFAARPGAPDALRLRAWDDAGKVVGLDVVGFEAHLPLLRRLARV